MKRSPNSQPVKKNTGKAPKKTTPIVQEPEEKDPIKGIDFTKTRNQADFDPLVEDMHKGADKHVNVVGDRTKLDQSIPAAEHKNATINLDDDSEMHLNNEGQYQANNDNSGGGSGGGGGFAGPKQEDIPFNEEFHEMPEEEKEESSRQMAIVIVEMYCGAKLLVPKAISISERELKKMEKAGEINLYQRVRYSKETIDTISVKEFVENFNKNLTEPFATKQEFKNNVIPILTRMLKKSGVGMTDTQALAYYVGVDFITTCYAGFQASRDRREMLDILREGNVVTAPKATGPVQPEPGSPAATVMPTASDISHQRNQGDAPVTGTNEHTEKITTIVNKVKEDEKGK